MTMIVQKLNKQIKETTTLTEEIVIMKKLFNKDLIVTAADTNIKNKLKKLKE